MKGFEKVKLEELSSIRCAAYVNEHEEHLNTDTLVLKFSGEYQAGSLGHDDALFILAKIKAYRSAWFPMVGTILDFSELKYVWGDEMEWVYGVTWDGTTRCRQPLAIIVGDECRQALESLNPSRYRECCVESFDEATLMISKKEIEYREYMRKWTPDRGKLS